MVSKLKQIINKVFYRPRIKKCGKNNQVNISTSAVIRRFSLEIYGNNNIIIVEDGVSLHNSKIRVGFSNCPVENCIIKIGAKTIFNSVLIQLGESDSLVEIGSECLFSHGIEINCTDHHSIFNENNELINIGKYVKIGSHVWVCKNVTVMKNTKIPDGCILAEGCIVTKVFDDENCIIAGNPAKVVKENIRWERTRPQNYLNSLRISSVEKG